MKKILLLLLMTLAGVLNPLVTFAQIEFEENHTKSLIEWNLEDHRYDGIESLISDKSAVVAGHLDTVQFSGATFPGDTVDVTVTNLSPGSVYLSFGSPEFSHSGVFQDIQSTASYLNSLGATDQLEEILETAMFIKGSGKQKNDLHPWSWLPENFDFRRSYNSRAYQVCGNHASNTAQLLIARGTIHPDSVWVVHLEGADPHVVIEVVVGGERIMIDPDPGTFYLILSDNDGGYASVDEIKNDTSLITKDQSLILDISDQEHALHKIIFESGTPVVSAWYLNHSEPMVTTSIEIPQGGILETSIVQRHIHNRSDSASAVFMAALMTAYNAGDWPTVYQILEDRSQDIGYYSGDHLMTVMTTLGNNSMLSTNYFLEDLSTTLVFTAQENMNYELKLFAWKVEVNGITTYELDSSSIELQENFSFDVGDEVKIYFLMNPNVINFKDGVILETEDPSDVLLVEYRHGIFYPDPGAGSLPVEFSSFTIEEKYNRPVLHWETAMEKDVDRFEIERSTDAVNFIHVGEVYAQGNSNSFLGYKWEDFSRLFVGVYYYRLKIVDNDNSFTYSNIRTYSPDESEQELFTVLGMKSVRMHCDGILYATDMSGRIVMQEIVTTGELVDIADKLHTGFYSIFMRRSAGDYLKPPDAVQIITVK